MFKTNMVSRLLVMARSKVGPWLWLREDRGQKSLKERREKYETEKRAEFGVRNPEFESQCSY